MASSSVSQEDVENDFEKLEKRSRIRTARARQINPQGCRQEAERALNSSNCITPLTLDIDDNLSELHLDPVTISPYNLPGEVAAADTSPKPKDANMRGDVLGERNNRKDSVRTTERNHPGKSHHGIKGKQQRDRRKLREKRRSTGVVHLASTESTGGSTSGEELSECDVGIETKRNTQQNETIGDNNSLMVTAEVEAEGGQVVAERKNSGRSTHTHTAGGGHARTRMRTKNMARSEDMEADDELGDKTDNDHERISPNSVMPSLSSQSEPSQRHGDTDLARQLQEKERRIQYLELKIQQLTQNSATILAEHEKLKQENCALLAAMGNNEEK